MQIRILNRILDFLLPRACVVCGSRLALEEQHFCTKCTFELPYWNDSGDQPYISLLRYIPDSKSSNIVKEIKYYGNIQLAEYMGKLFADYKGSSQELRGADAIIPVPLTKSRQRERGYNQSEEIAKGIGKSLGIPVLSSAICRKTFSVSQTRLTSSERLKNVKDVFEVIDASILEGKHLLLFDDVITTGATMVSLARTIQKTVPNVKITYMSLCISKDVG